MKSGKLIDAVHWYVIHTHPRQEDRAERNLRSEGLETLFPKLRERRYNQYTGEPTQIIKPLFPRYLFARFNASELLHKVSYTRGVHCVVAFGGRPTPLESDIIALIQSRIGADGFVRIGEELKPGDQILVRDGPLKNFIGIFEREMKGSDRVMILLTTIGYQAHVMIERDLLQRLKS